MSEDGATGDAQEKQTGLGVTAVVRDLETGTQTEPVACCQGFLGH